nr:helix-turn-helix domain-containing protein [Legionella jordanis]
MSVQIPIHPALRTYVHSISVVNASSIDAYRIFPGLYPVLGFQFQGELAYVDSKNDRHKLKHIGITGLLTCFRDFQALSANTGSVLLTLYPWAIPKLFQIPARALSNRSLGLCDIIKPAAANVLQEQIALAKSMNERLSLIQSFLLGQCQLNRKLDNSRIKSFWHEVIKEDDLGKLGNLAKSYSYSERSLQRHFLDCIGLSPKQYLRVIRLQNSLKQLENQSDWSQIQTADAYFDQSHFIKEFKKMTGQTPKAFAKNLII